MIKNQKQAGVARERIASLNQSLCELVATKNSLNAAEFEIGFNSLNYLIADIQKDINEYDALVGGHIRNIPVGKLSDINKIMIYARIAQQLSQKELATRIGIQEQQIQRYEATDYESVTWTRLLEICEALNLNIQFKPVSLKPERPHFRTPRDMSQAKIQRAKIAIRYQKCLNFTT